MNIVIALGRLREMEEAMGAHYKALAQCYAAEPAVAAFFKQLAHDEEAHARMVEFESRLVVGNSGQFGDAQLDPTQLKSALDAVRSQRPIPGASLEQALRFAYDMEKSAGEAHGLAVVAELSPKLRKLLAALDAGDRYHAQTLERFARSLGIELV